MCLRIATRDLIEYTKLPDRHARGWGGRSARDLRFGEPPFEAATVLPPTRSVFPDLANSAGLDTANRRLRIAHHDVTVCLKLERGKCTADLSRFVSTV